MATNPGFEFTTRTSSKRSGRKKKRGPHCVVKSGSAAVPVYRCDSGGRVRYAITYYRDGRRLRQFFPMLDAAKKEALFVAQRIQSGMQHITDLKPHERDTFLATRKLADGAGVPLIAALEDYLRARQLAVALYRKGQWQSLTCSCDAESLPKGGR